MPWRSRVSQWWLLRSELDLSFSLKVSDINTLQSVNRGCVVCHTLHIQSLLLINQLVVWSSSGLVEQINNFQTLRLRDFNAFNLDPFLSIDDDYFYHTQYPRRPEVSIIMWISLAIHKPFLWWVTYSTVGQLLSWHFICLFVFYKVGDVRVRFSFTGLSGETSHLGQAQTVSAADNCLIISGLT